METVAYRSHIALVDGGGVRGLSLLLLRLLLQALIRYINEFVQSKMPETPKLQLQDIFELVARTTGGLIALMLVKMGMGVEECI